MLDTAQGARAPSFLDFLQVRPHHLRSVQIERDFPDPSSTLHYVVTPFVEATVKRIAQGFQTNSTARAWRLTGDYGSGKSSLALALARLAASEPEFLPSALREHASPMRLEPVLVVGEREPIGKGILRALSATLSRRLKRIPQSLNSVLKGADRPEPMVVVDALAEATKVLKEAGAASGIFLVLDELGKNLEYAVNRTDAEDVYLLQHLSEWAARSGEAPVVVVAVLHQAVASYASALPTVQRREWEKVAGRFEEVVFAPPMEQTANLIAAALDVDLSSLPRPLVTRSRSVMEAALDLAWYGPAAGREGLVAIAPGLLPLDPVTLPVLSRLLRRFGQNERSLFSFLSSAEPFGLMEHSAQPIARFAPYRLHDLYDYIVANLSSLVSLGTMASRWAVVEEIVSGSVSDAVELSVLKTVAILNLLDEPQLAATPSIVALAIAGVDPVLSRKAKDAIERLKTGSRVLYDRGASGSLCLWPHTSVDLEDAFNKALAAVRTSGVGIDAVRSLLPTEPIVARRHYVETGALRHFDVRYEAASQAKSALARVGQDQGVDGEVLILLSTNESEYRDVLAHVEASVAGLPETAVVGVPRPIGSILPMLSEVAAWRWIRENVRELAGDRVARNEAARQLALAEAKLSRSLETLLHIRGSAAQSMVWHHSGKRLEIASGRALTSLISNICDTGFSRSPRVRNELINRRTLSSAAAAARFRVIEGLGTAVNQPSLGLDNGGTPPELAIYLSVIKAGNIHCERNGQLAIQIPPEDSDPLRLRPALLRIGEVLAEAGDKPVAYEAVADGIRGGKYAVREGLVPLLIAVYIAANWHRTAVYEDGTYLEQVGDREFSRIVKEPEHFQLQHCVIEGVRAEIFARLSVALGMSVPPGPTDLLDVVRPLVTFVARLPDHARRTRQLTASTVAARAALLGGRDPTALIFRELPQAFGLETFEAGKPVPDAQIDVFIKAVSTTVGELREAYPSMLKRVARSIGAALECDEVLAVQRPELMNRAERVRTALSEPELKAFVLRIADHALDDQAWLESVASLVAKKPPERWADSDEADFHHRLPILARRFRHVEAMRFSREGESTNTYRLLVTASDGQEVEQVYRLAAGEEEMLASVELELRAILEKRGKLGKLAAAKVLLELDKEESR
ncbi:hypothetical protein ACC805_12300 [Rhizobium ruizarguesonis]